MFLPRKLFMRPVLLLSALLCLSSCGDSIMGPNTDVGLSVWVEVTPLVLSVRDSTAVLHMRVYVGNASNHEVRVVSGGPPYVFTADPSRSKGLWGSLRIATNTEPLNAGPNVDWWGDSVYVFPAHHVEYDELTVTLHDWKSRGWAATPGTYTVRGWFNSREGKSAALVLTR
jgi:hypothetical protein